MIKYFLITLVFLVGLSACGYTRIITAPDPHAIAQDASSRLAKAATGVSQSLETLASLAKATGSTNFKPLPYPAPDGPMSQLATVNWSGPIQPLLREIAALSGYTLEEIGQEPAFPILVQVRKTKKSLDSIIRHINDSIGTQANIITYPAIHVIELRYGHI